MDVERRYVLVSLAAVVAVVAALAVVDLTREEPPREARIDLIRGCLEDEKGALVFELPLTSPLADAPLGGLTAIVERGNEVSVGLFGSTRSAHGAAAELRGEGEVVRRRGDIVYVWDHAPSPTQRKAILDCSY